MDNSSDHLTTKDNIYLDESFKSIYSSLEPSEQQILDEFVKNLSEKVDDISKNFKNRIFNNSDDTIDFIEDLDSALDSISNEENTQDAEVK